MKLTPRTLIGVGRLGVGAVSLLAPSTSARLFGLDPERSNGFVARLFGSRELLLAGSLLAAKGPAVRTAALIGVAVDGLDVASAAVEAKQGRLSTYAAAIGGGGAALFVLLGLLASRET